MGMSSALTSAPVTAPNLVGGVLESFDGTRIAYDLYDLPSRTLVLVIPGFWRFRRHPSMTGLAGRLNALGYRTAIADPRGHGDSGGVYGFNLHEHHDIAAVARTLMDRLPVEEIALIALSYGASIAISTAARHPDLPITSLFLISAVADFGMIVPHISINPFTIYRHIALSQAFHRPRFDLAARRSAKLSALEDIRALHVPVSLLHVKNDWLIHHAHSEALFAAANEPKEMHILDIPGQYHADRIFKLEEAHADDLLSDWLRRFAPV
jgi:pimeloyl-ACP methyl ester carboxylesterase